MVRSEIFVEGKEGNKREGRSVRKDSCPVATEDSANNESTTIDKTVPTPSRVWEQVQVNFARATNGSYFIVVIDKLSAWPEITIVRNISSANTVRILNAIFKKNGIPNVIITGKWTQFTSDTFSTFHRMHSITHSILSSDGNDSTIQQLKSELMTLPPRQGWTLHQQTDEILFLFRHTFLTALHGKQPGEIFRMDHSTTSYRPEGTTRRPDGTTSQRRTDGTT